MSLSIAFINVLEVITEQFTPVYIQFVWVSCQDQEASVQKRSL